MFRQDYIQMCINQGQTCGEASFADVIMMCCGC
jgi:hypothetical protein